MAPTSASTWSSTVAEGMVCYPGDMRGGSFISVSPVPPGHHLVTNEVKDLPTNKVEWMTTGRILGWGDSASVFGSLDYKSSSVVCQSAAL